MCRCKTRKCTIFFFKFTVFKSGQGKNEHILQKKKFFYLEYSGFGGLGVACWPLVPKFAGSNPAEAVVFLGRKNPQHAFLRKGSKAVVPMS